MAGPRGHRFNGYFGVCHRADLAHMGQGETHCVAGKYIAAADQLVGEIRCTNPTGDATSCHVSREGDSQRPAHTGKDFA